MENLKESNRFFGALYKNKTVMELYKDIEEDEARKIV
jgi:hypothetical protein